MTDYTCTTDFTGIVGGKEVKFAPGQTIKAADAAELGLAGKPDIAEPAKASKKAVAPDA